MRSLRHKQSKSQKRKGRIKRKVARNSIRVKVVRSKRKIQPKTLRQRRKKRSKTPRRTLECQSKSSIASVSLIVSILNTSHDSLHSPS